MKPIYVLGHELLDVSFRFRDKNPDEEVPLSYNVLAFFLEKAILRYIRKHPEEKNVEYPEISDVFVIAKCSGLNGYKEDLVGKMDVSKMRDTNNSNYVTKNDSLVDDRGYMKGLISYIEEDVPNTKVVVAKSNILPLVNRDVLGLVGKLGVRDVDYEGIEKSRNSQDKNKIIKFPALHTVVEKKNSDYVNAY